MRAPNLHLSVALYLATLLVACSASTSELGPSADSGAAQTDTGGFCAAFAVIQKKCERCHSNPPAHGAPFPLDSYAATQAPLGDEPRSDRMREVVMSGFMPLTSLKLDPPVEALSCGEKATLLAWLDNGAPPPPDADPTCEKVSTSLLACDEPAQ